MSKPSEWAMVKAFEIVLLHAAMARETTLVSVIAAALDDARKVPGGHVREGTTDYPLLGTLPTTADGVVVGDVPRDGAALCYREHDGSITDTYVTLCLQYPDDKDGIWYVIEDNELNGTGRWYSTREAAEKAGKDGREVAGQGVRA